MRRRTLTRAVVVNSIEKRNSLVDLSKYTRLTPGAAQALSQYDGWHSELDLSGLTSLPSSVARMLPEYRSITLDSLPRISPQALSAICHLNGDELILGGLRTLSESVSGALGSVQSPSLSISLPSVSRLGRIAADRLPGLTCDSIEIGLEEISMPIALPLGKLRANRLVLERLTQIDAKSLAALLAFPGELDLSSVREISGEVDVSSVSPRARSVDLAGLHLSKPWSLSVLSEFNGDLVLGPGAQCILTSEPPIGKLSALTFTGLPGLKPNDATALSRLAPKLHIKLNGALTSDSLAALLASPCERVVVSTSDLSYSFSRKGESFDIRKIVDLSVNEIRNASVWRLIREFGRDVTIGANVDISPSVARHLSGVPGRLSIMSTELSDRVIEVLARRNGALHLDRLTELSRAAIASLSNHRGELSLRGMSTVSEGARAIIDNHSGPVYLSSPEELLPTEYFDW